MKRKTQLKESQKRLKGFWKNTFIHLIITTILYLLDYTSLAIISLYFLGAMIFFAFLEYLNVLHKTKKLKEEQSLEKLQSNSKSTK